MVCVRDGRSRVGGWVVGDGVKVGGFEGWDWIVGRSDSLFCAVSKQDAHALHGALHQKSWTPRRLAKISDDSLRTDLGSPSESRARAYPGLSVQTSAWMSAASPAISLGVPSFRSPLRPCPRYSIPHEVILIQDCGRNGRNGREKCARSMALDACRS